MFSPRCLASLKVKYVEVLMNPKNHYLSRGNVCRLAIQLLFQVRRSPCEHGAMEVHRNHENKEGTEQVLIRKVMLWCYTSRREWDPIPAQFQHGIPTIFQIFSLVCWKQSEQSLDFSGRAGLRFIWKHPARRQGRITERVTLEGTTGDYLVQPPRSSRVSQSTLLRRMRKDLCKYLKNTVPSHIQGMAPHF